MDGLAVGYASLPGDGPEDELMAQEDLIVAGSRRLGLTVEDLVHDHEGTAGRRARSRPGLEYALGRVRDSGAAALVATSLRRVGRSAVELGALMERLQRARIRLVAIGEDLDTGTPEGAAAAQALIIVGTLEQERLRERTRSGLAVARQRRAAGARPAVADRPELEERITRLRGEGKTLQAIADELNAEGVPTVRGGARWRPSSLHRAAGYKRRGPDGGARLAPVGSGPRSRAGR